MKSKYILNDIVLFYKIGYEDVNIRMSDYIAKMRSDRASRITRQNESIANHSDIRKI